MNILKLRGKMVEKECNVDSLATELEIDRATVYRKLNDAEKFTVGEARKITTLLDLTKDEVHEIFFT